MNEAKILIVLCVCVIGLLLSGCATGGRLYIGYERHDVVDNVQKATDGNFLCSVMGYCREGEKK